MPEGLTVLGLAGSPRRGGNTDLLLEQALAGATSEGATVERIVLSDLRIHPCRHCDGCLKTGLCIIEDDMQPIHRKLREVDRLILAAPLMFMGVSAQAKTAIDRCQALWVAKYILKERHTTGSDGGRRRGLFLSTGGMRRPNLFEPAMATVRALFATCDLAFQAALTYQGVDEKGAIAEHPTALSEAFAAGARLVRPAPAKEDDVRSLGDT
ncbi:MAG: flavodoxin family protein [Chloroflexota bacterium]